MGSSAITLEVLSARWQLFGHILRSNQQTPANKMMGFYFNHIGVNRRRGQLPISLHILLHKDLTTIGLQLKSYQHLQQLRTTAINRPAWTALWKSIHQRRKAEINQTLILRRRPEVLPPPNNNNDIVPQAGPRRLVLILNPELVIRFPRLRNAEPNNAALQQEAIRQRREVADEIII